MRNQGVSALLTLVMAFGVLGGAAARVRAQAIVAPAKPQPILGIRDVRIGMTGYGLTVFHGTKIEPFAVEVVSVMHDFGPKQGVIWIKCSDPRLDVSGPVQGMSGSPIYLWDDSVEKADRKLGHHGKLIGAFAYGYSAVLECYAGVQPIELMRDVATRADQKDEPDGAGEKGAGDDQASAPSQHRGPTLRQTLAAMDGLDLHASAGWRPRLLADVLEPRPAGDAPDQPDNPVAAARPPIAAPPQLQQRLPGEARPMQLPFNVPSRAVADLLAPLCREAGLAPMVGPAAGVIGQPPQEIDPTTVNLEPGSMLAIPLGYGDLDLSASGTVTEVLPDGRVLAFGHAMFGEGPVALPMATGFVHYIVPTRGSSFKLAGTVSMLGSVVRDENSAIVATKASTYRSAPVTVTLNVPGQERETYRYRVAHHRALTPQVLAAMVATTVEARRTLPIENSTRINATMTFTGDRGDHQLTLDTTQANANGASVATELLPIVGTMMNNPFAELELKSVEMDVQSRSGRRDARIIAARIERTLVQPGDTVDAIIDLKTPGQPVKPVRIEFTIPKDLEEGDYPLIICDPQQALGYQLQTQPHLRRVENIHELVAMVQTILDAPSNALFAMMPRQQPQLAIGRAELPDLPSSIQTILNARTSTTVTTYQQWHIARQDIDVIPAGEFQFTLNVRRPNGANGAGTQGGGGAGAGGGGGSGE